MPSVGSPGGPGLVSWRVLERNTQKEGEGTRTKETIKEKEVAGRSKHSACLGKKKRLNFSQCFFFIKDEQRVHMQERLMEEMEKGASASIEVACLHVF